MSHFSTKEKEFSTTPANWLSVGSKIGQVVNDWSFRTDLVVRLGEKTQSGAPAAFNPASAEIEINTHACFLGIQDPNTIGDFTQRLTQLEHPVASGAIYHEACHARFSRWSLETASKELSQKEFSALALLEEGRIESWGIKTDPTSLVFLQSSAMQIVLGDLEDNLHKLDNTAGAAHLAALTLARVDAGVLLDSDVEPVREILDTILGEEILAKLRIIWNEFQAHEKHSDPAELYDLAKEWVKVVEERQEERGESPDQRSFIGEGAGEAGEAGEDDSDELSEIAKQILGALIEASENNSISSNQDVNDAMLDEEHKQEVEARAKQAESAKENKKIANAVFGRVPSSGSDSDADTDASGAGTEDSHKEKSNSRLIERRQPTSDERASAVRISRLLQKAKYRDRSVVKITTALPGGRLRSRAMVQGAALKAKGIQTQVEPWRQKKRKHTDSPELKVGVMVDISGSMGLAMKPMATTAWVLSEAVRRIQGTAAMVYYGNDVFATLKPGQSLRDVQVYTAPDNTEKFGKAFKALDGAMDLIHGNGARLLVIVSDGYYGYDERVNAKQIVKTATANGVGVLWIQIAGSGSNIASSYITGTTAEVITIDPDGSPSVVSTLIGSTAARVLTNAGRVVA